MSGRNIDRSKDLQFDSLASEIVRAAVPADKEAESAADAPFLFVRVKAKIADQQSDESALPYSPSFFTKFAALRIAFAVIALVVSAGFWVARARSLSNNEPLTPTPQTAGISACSISNGQQCSISTNDVIQAVIGTGSQGSN